MPHLWCYEVDTEGTETKFSVKSRASELARIFFSAYLTFLRGSSKRPELMAIGYPAQYLGGAPIAAFLAARVTGRDVLVLARSGGAGEPSSPFVRHQRAYSLLAEGRNGDIFALYTAPCGVLENDELRFTAQVPLARHHWFREQYVSMLRERFQGGQYPLVIFRKETDLRQLKEVRGVLGAGRKAEALGLRTTRLGTIIIEGAEHLIFTEYRLREFVEWLGSFDATDLKILLHFSDPWSPILDWLHKDYRAVTIRLTPQFLQINRETLSRGAPHCEKDGNSIWDRVLLDSEGDYQTRSALELKRPLLPAGNADAHWQEIQRLLGAIGRIHQAGELAVYRRLFKVARNVLSIVSRPSELVMGFPSLEDGSYLLRRMDGLLEAGRTVARRLGGEQGLRLMSLCDQVGSALFELETLHRRNETQEDGTTKLDRIIDFLHEDSGNAIVSPLLTEDTGPLRARLEKESFDGCVSVLPIESLVRRWFDRSETCLLLPGSVPWRYVSELLRPYRKVLFFGYGGSQETAILEQISALSMVTAEDYWKCLLSLRRVSSMLPYSIADVITFAEAGLKELAVAVQAQRKVELRDATSVDDIVARLRQDTIRLTRPRLLDKLEQEIDSSASELEPTAPRPVAVVKVLVRDHERPEITTRLELRVDRTYVYAAPGTSNITEVFPSEMEAEGVLALIDDDKRKTLLDLIVELYDIGEPVDVDLVDRWKRIIGDYSSKSHRSKRSVYDDYVNACRSEAIGSKRPRVYGTVCTWLRGEVIAPEDASDLRALGFVTGSSDLQADADAIVAEANKVRRLHVRVGLRMNGITRALIDGREVSELSYEELVIRSKIRLYRLIDLSGRIEQARLD